ncbi:MAG: PQQ-binding-like beta-propeller repeat protein [Bacteriovoracaceae bacterium]|nr:PQQ-binding-like beta-propeller repeat protein [Bacteriovoracaceae bacterium]
MINILVLFLTVGCASIKSSLKKTADLVEAPQKETKVFNVAWAKNLDPEHLSGNLPIGAGSPLIVEDLVFMGSLDGVMRSYQLDTGRLLWEVDEKQPINAKPSLFEDLVVYGTMEGRVFARNYVTGELEYSIDLGSPVESAPVVSGGRMFFHLRDHKIVAMDASTGKLFWSYRRSVPFTTTLQRVSRALPYKNKIIVGFADGYLVSLSMEEGVIVWEQKLSSALKFVDVDVDPVYYNGSIVAGSASDYMKFINPENGVILRTVNLKIAHSPIKINNNLVVGTIFGKVAIIGPSGEVILKKSLLNEGVSSLAKWKDGIAVATMSGKVFHLDPVSLKVKGEFNLGHGQSAVFGQLQTTGSHLALYSSRNRLYVFR